MSIAKTRTKKCQWESCNNFLEPKSKKYCNDCRAKYFDDHGRRKIEACKKRLRTISCTFEGCSILFETTSNGQKYCDDCSIKAEKRNRKKVKDKMKKGPRLVICQFEGCNKVFEVAARAHSTKYCDGCKKIKKQLWDKEDNKKNKEKRASKRKKYREKNREQIKLWKKHHYEKNKTEILLKQKEYYNDNKESIRKSKNRYKKRKRAEDPSYKLREVVSRDINRGMHLRGYSKNGKSCWDHLEYTPDALKKHLEILWSHINSLDENGEIWMTWDNYGPYSTKRKTWQIDHIKPHSDFHYTSMDDLLFQECWSLANLRPLDSRQNMLDGVNRIRHINKHNKAA
jgi:hypothetical protein